MGISGLFITFIDFHSFLCRNGWQTVFRPLQVFFDGYIRIWFEAVAYRRICVLGLFITFIDLRSVLSSTDSRASSGTSEADQPGQSFAAY
jgi:hypothetical protein